MAWDCSGCCSVNTQAVTLLTWNGGCQHARTVARHRDHRQRFVYGKMGGILYNTKEVIAAPLGFLLWQAGMDRINAENAAYLMVGFAVLCSLRQCWACTSD